MKPIAAGRQIATVIRRSADLHIRNSPEGKMRLAAIELALAEADKKNRSEEPRRFLSSEGFCLILEMLGLDADFVLELIRDHARWMRPMEAAK